MKRNLRTLLLGLVLFSILNPRLSTCLAQGTAFTYQGRLSERGAEANGTFDFRFTIYDRETGGTPAFAPVTAARVAVSNGLFSVQLDFGALGSTPRWLEIEVQSRTGSSGYAVLSPRQPLTATPRAHYALQAGDVLNPVPDALVPPTVARLGGSNVFTGAVSFVVPPRFEGPPFTVNTAAQVPNLNADYLDGLDSSAFWKVVGNAGTAPDFHFLGTTDNQPLELRVNNERALRLDPGLVDGNHAGINVIGGAAVNYVAPGVIGATIAGGGAGNFFLTPLSNRVAGSFGVIGGGFQNAIGNLAFATTVGGGRFNVNNGSDSAIGGGFGNTNTAFAAAIPGGYYNVTAGSYGFAAGRRAKAMHDGAFVWADSQNVDFASTGPDQFCVRAGGGVRLSPPTSLFWGGSHLWADQGGAMELGDSVQNGATPYIDFHFGVGSSQDFNVRLINDANGQLTLSGNQQITGNLGFGAQTRQMLNLWGSAYGIGVQSSAAYFRTDHEFFWYRRGSHSDTFSDPGPGGSQLMRLGSTGNLIIAGTLSQGSDRNIKQDFTPLDAQEVLRKVATLPLHSWAYTNDPGCRHVGPIAQDFHAAFGLNGNDDKHIATVDADGVALAAIQGLNAKVEARNQESRVRSQESEARIAKLEAENAELNARLEKLERLLDAKNGGAQ